MFLAIIKADMQINLSYYGIGCFQSFNAIIFIMISAPNSSNQIRFDLNLIWFEIN